MKVTVSGALEFQIDEEEPTFIWSIIHNSIITKNVTMLILPNDQKVTASIQPVDSKGNPAQIQGPAQWSSSNDNIASLQNIAADGLSADVIPGATLGTCQINVQGDADLGTGVTTITGVLDVQVVAGAAVGFTITTSPPQPI